MIFGAGSPQTIRATLEGWITSGTPALPDLDIGKVVLDAEAIEGIREMQEEDAPSLVAELFGDFLADLNTQFSQLAGHIANNDTTQAGRLAHRLKGSCGTLGLREMEHWCGQLDQAGRKGQRDGMEELYARILAAWKRAEPSVRAEMAR